MSVHRSMKRLSLDDKRSFLKGLKFRANLMFPESQGRLVASLDQMLAGLDDGDEAKREAIAKRAAQYGELIAAAARGDGTAHAALAKMRIERVNNFLEAKSDVLKFFKTVTLEANEMPVFENQTRQVILVHYLAQDGGYRRTKPIKQLNAQQIDLHILTTEEYEYPLWDLRLGLVADDAKANIDMADDMDRQIETLLWPFVRRMIGPFKLTGPNAQRTYVPHPGVNTKNLPTTNLLLPVGDANTATTLWRKSCMDAVLQYCASWGQSLEDGVIKPVEVNIPSSELMGWLQQIQMTSFGNTLVEQVMEQGFVMKYAGMDWLLVGDETLDPDQGMAFVRTNHPIGEFYQKPSLDKSWDDLCIANQKQNKGVMSQQKVIGAGLPAPWAPYVMGVQYHTPRN